MLWGDMADISQITEPYSIIFSANTSGRPDGGPQENPTHGLRSEQRRRCPTCPSGPAGGDVFVRSAELERPAAPESC
jgi:hypothetical protein